MLAAKHNQPYTLVRLYREECSACAIPTPVLGTVSVGQMPGWVGVDGG